MITRPSTAVESPYLDKTSHVFAAILVASSPAKKAGKARMADGNVSGPPRDHEQLETLLQNVMRQRHAEWLAAPEDKCDIARHRFLDALRIYNETARKRGID